MPQNSEEAGADPSNLSFETAWTRRKILASYWIAVILAIPLWWKITSIDRLSLPGARVRSLDGKELLFPIAIAIQDLPTPQQNNLKVKLLESLEHTSTSQGLSVNVTTDGVAAPAGPGQYVVSASQDESGWLLSGRELHVGTSALQSFDRLSDSVEKLLLPYNFRSSSDAHRVVKYAPRYRLAFTLLNEDTSSGNAAISWELEDAIHKYLDPTLHRLSVLHNFTIESQVQFHAPLAFTPRALEEDGQSAYGLTQEDLTVFVNSAEWTLSSSVSNDPVLHFVLFIPSSKNSPLYILDQSGTPTSSDAFILPQWGGIIILDKPDHHLSTSLLHRPFAIFQQQLLSLLGVPSLPSGIEFKGPEPFSDWQLDALVRHRARENLVTTRETLTSIVALVKQIDNMPVGQGVRGDVQDSLTALENALGTARVSSMAALQYSSEALTLASRAFFNPGMLALLYFPAEHKYAVYTPLFASVAAPLVAAVLREVAAWRKQRKAAAAARVIQPPVDRQRVQD